MRLCGYAAFDNIKVLGFRDGRNNAEIESLDRSTQDASKFFLEFKMGPTFRKKTDKLSPYFR